MIQNHFHGKRWIEIGCERLLKQIGAESLIPFKCASLGLQPMLYGAFVRVGCADADGGKVIQKEVVEVVV
jgi:hypothetical protein